MKRAYKTYYGAKGSSGTYQTIINVIRPHDYFYEPFAGNATITNTIRPCIKTVLNDLDIDVYRSLKEHYENRKDIEVLNMNGIDLLIQICENPKPKTVVYIDPPYPITSIKNVPKYNHILSDLQHKKILSIIKNANCDILISTYPNSIYADELKDWNLIEFESLTRKGKAIEHLYLNYHAVDELHDYTFLGCGHRERQIIKKKVRRWKKNFRNLPILERRMMLQELLLTM